MSKHKYSTIFALIGDINKASGKLNRKEFIRDFTLGATDSLTALSEPELIELERSLRLLAPKPVFDQKADKCRKAIIAIYKSMGKSTDFAINWAENNGVAAVKKTFNDYTVAELMKLIRVAEKIKAGYIKKVAKSSKKDVVQ